MNEELKSLINKLRYRISVQEDCPEKENAKRCYYKLLEKYGLKDSDFEEKEVERKFAYKDCFTLQILKQILFLKFKEKAMRSLVYKREKIVVIDLFEEEYKEACELYNTLCSEYAKRLKKFKKEQVMHLRAFRYAFLEQADLLAPADPDNDSDVSAKELKAIMDQLENYEKDPMHLNKKLLEKDIK